MALHEDQMIGPQRAEFLRIAESVAERPWAIEKLRRAIHHVDEPEVSVRAIQPSPGYLDFLETQIRLNARGDEWTSILKSRLAGLSGAGQDVIEIHVGLRGPGYWEYLECFAVYIDWKTRKVIHVEAF